MGAWCYAYCFSTVRLKPYSIIDAIPRTLSVGDRVFEGVSIDESGHVEGVGRAFDLPRPCAGQVQSMLVDGRDLLFTLEGPIDVSVDVALSNCVPKISFGWPQGRFREMPVAEQESYLSVLRRLASAASATHVFVVSESAGFFEDEIDVTAGGISLNDGWGSSLKEVWVSRCLLPSDVWESTDQLDHGFSLCVFRD